jgi:phage terminase large subunit
MAQTITVPFKPHFYQKEILDFLKRFSIFVCHRRFGKTVLVVNLLVKWALATQRKNWRAGYIAPLYRQAKEIAWDYLQHYSRCVPGIKFNQNELKAEFPNGSRITLLGADNPDSLRGPYWDAAVFDEYAQIRPRVFPEIIRPALVDRKGWAIFIGTPMGHNHFYDLWNEAHKSPDLWAALMYKASKTNILDPAELAQARKEMSPEQYEQEFECSFEAAIVGAYYGPMMQDSLEQGRITAVPYDPILPVHTAWDLGVDDATVIWFFQVSPGGEVRLIDYHEENNQGLDYYVSFLKSKPYIYGKHLGPHDIKVREFSSGRSRIEFAQSLGINFDVAPNIPVADGIQAVRSIIPRCWFDEKKCDKGIQALKTYRKEYSEKLSTFRDSALHDWASHGADAFRILAVGMDMVSPVPVLKLKPERMNVQAGRGWML